MDRNARKAAIADYKERKPAIGVYAVICNATGQAWVGQSRHLETQATSLWFQLRHGGSPFRDLQAAWNSHGEGEFRFEELDRLREDFPALTLKSELQQRQMLWKARLHASAI